MRKITFLTVLISISMVLMSFGLFTVTEDTEAIGPVGTLMFSNGMDYPGGPEGEPVDLLEGNPTGSYDLEEGPVKTIAIETEIGIQSNTPHLLQDVVIHFDIYDENGLIGGMEYLDFTTDPEVVVFEQVLPNREYWMNVTFYVDITRMMGSGVDVLYISEWYSVTPGVAGEDVIMTVGLPLEILSFNDGAIFQKDGPPMKQIDLEMGETEKVYFDIVNYGNVEYPDLDVNIDGLDDAEEMGFDIITEFESMGGEHGQFWVFIDAEGASPGVSFELALILVDDRNGTELGEPVYLDVRINEDPSIDPGDQEEPEEPEGSAIEIEIDDFEYGSYRTDGILSSEIIVEGTTSGCAQLVIMAGKKDLDIYSDHSWKIDTYDTEGPFRYDGSGCTYHIKEFEDTSYYGDWSSFKLHIYYTVDMEYFKDLWETGPIVVDETSFPDVGDEITFSVIALENVFDIEGGNGTWAGTTYVVEAQPYEKDDVTMEDPFGPTTPEESDNTKGLLAAGILIILLTIILALIPFVIPLIIIIIIVVVVVKANSKKKRN